MRWQRNLNLCVHRAPPQSPGGLWMLYQSAIGQVSMQADRVGPFQPQVPEAEFGLGVRRRLALTSGVPEQAPWQATGGRASFYTSQRPRLESRGVRGVRVAEGDLEEKVVVVGSSRAVLPPFEPCNVAKRREYVTAVPEWWFGFVGVGRSISRGAETSSSDRSDGVMVGCTWIRAQTRTHGHTDTWTQAHRHDCPRSQPKT
jgi:hypothetical protein